MMRGVEIGSAILEEGFKTMLIRNRWSGIRGGKIVLSAAIC